MKFNQHGLTMIEVLAGNAIIAVVIFASLFIYKDVVSNQVASQLDFSRVLGRNRILSNVKDNQSWAASVEAIDNPELSCLLKQSNVLLADRDCSALQNQKINLYRIDGNMAIEFKNAGFGLDRNGNNCTTFVPAPGTPDGFCILGVNTEVSAQCPTANPVGCYNPLLLVNSAFTAGFDFQKVVNLRMYDFRLYLAGIYCPAQVSDNTWLGDAQIKVAGSQVMAIYLPAQVGHYAKSNLLVYPCRQANFDFLIDATKYDYGVAGNQTQVCISDADTGTCAFTLKHKIMPDSSLSYDIFDGLNLVGTKPSWLNLAGNEIFSFQVVNGLVRFCVNYQCLHTMETKLHTPFRILVYPGQATADNQPIISNFLMNLSNL